MRLGREQGGGGHDLAGLAVAALDDLEIEPGLLHPAAGRSFPRRLDGRDGFARGSGHRRDAGADRPAIEMHRAGSAQRRAAAELGAGQSDDVAQYPERSEEHTSELQSQSNLVCRLLLEKEKKNTQKSMLCVTTTYDPR